MGIFLIKKIKRKWNSARALRGGIIPSFCCYCILTAEIDVYNITRKTDEVGEMVQLSLGRNVFSIPVVTDVNRGRVEIHGAIQRRQLQYLLIIENTTKQHLPQEDNGLLHHDALVKYLNVGNDVDSRAGFFLNPTHV